jgi:hypothetical protein
MTLTCSCGYEADGSEDLRDHLGEVFIPRDDTALDGQVHAEPPRDDHGGDSPTRHCACGLAFPDATAVDEHLLAAFTPDDHIGLDGRKHITASAT